MIPRLLIAALAIAVPTVALAQDMAPTEQIRAEGPTQDMVTGTGVLGNQFGAPLIYVNAQGTGEQATGRFVIDYTGSGRVAGSVSCLVVNGDTAYLVGLVESERRSAESFDVGDYVVIGVRDASNGGADYLNFTQGMVDRPMCGPHEDANPTLRTTEGNFVVTDHTVPTT